MHATRRDLIRGLWPDKTMQAAVVVLLASVASLLFYVERAVFDITFADSVPTVLQAEPSQVMAFFALIAGILAIVALYRKHVAWGWAAVLVSALSVGPLGSGILVALLGAGFLVFAHKEREHKTAETRALSVREWPDKAFAASLILVVAGILSLVWGIALVFGFITLQSVPSLVLGILALIGGLAAVGVAPLLRQERAFGAGIAASVLCIVGLGLYVVGPLLGIVSLVLLWMANREGEFQTKLG